MSKTTYDWEFLTQLGMDTLAADQGAGWPDAALEEPVEEPVRLLAGRYALDDILGRGVRWPRRCDCRARSADD